MLIANSHNNTPIRLTNERWQHITTRHPEMIDLKQKVLETITEPDIIQQGDFGELLAIRFYYETPLTSKFLVVAYREISQDDGFIITAYLTNEPSHKRVNIWKR
ncbi:MAG: hypothetical protein QG641_2597 [Candidatus Poribacteria bacterium]|nr:hypothetical protein [Candidatus Poribacteria bacterium]